MIKSVDDFAFKTQCSSYIRIQCNEWMNQQLQETVSYNHGATHAVQLKMGDL